jgi:hypothetical protein
MNHVANTFLAGLVTFAALAAAPGEVTLTSAGKVRTYANCAALNRAYPHGVGLKGAKDKVAKGGKPVTTFTRNDAVYNANRKSDRDRDGIACEKR